MQKCIYKMHPVHRKAPEKWTLPFIPRETESKIIFLNRVTIWAAECPYQVQFQKLGGWCSGEGNQLSMNQESQPFTLEINEARRIRSLPENCSEQKKGRGRKSGSVSARSHWEYRYFHSSQISKNGAQLYSCRGKKKKKNEYSKSLPNSLSARSLHIWRFWISL